MEQRHLPAFETGTLALAHGTSIVTESIFENRFKYVDELTRMCATIKVEGNSAIIYGTALGKGPKKKSCGAGQGLSGSPRSPLVCDSESAAGYGLADRQSKRRRILP